MNFYQPYSILFKNTANDKLKIQTRVYLPGYQGLETYLSTTGAVTTLEIRTFDSSSEQKDRVVEITEVFSWDGEDHTVENKVYEFASTSPTATNALHTSGATQY